MKGKGAIILVIVVVLALIIARSGLFVVDEMHYAIVTQFGDPKEEITEPGLYFKTPFIQDVNYLPKQVLQWKGAGKEFVTKDKTYIWSNTWARWRIVNPLRFYQRLRGEQNGHSALDDQIESAAKTVIASYDLIEVVRNSNRELAYAVEELKEAKGKQRDIRIGRETMCQEIQQAASKVVREQKEGTLESEYGMELVDVQISTVIYVPEVQKSVYERMRAERKRIAQRYRSEGQEQANAIVGQTQRELLTIESEGYQKAQQLRGEGDAEALSIYAKTYSKDPEFYRFWKTLKTYEESIDERTFLILSLDNDYFKLLGSPELLSPKPAP